MADGHLNLQERYRIHALKAARLSLRAIAGQLERTPSTISQEQRQRKPVGAARRKRGNPSPGPTFGRQRRRCAGRAIACRERERHPTGPNADDARRKPN
jgi:IS30 family transposase